MRDGSFAFDYDQPFTPLDVTKKQTKTNADVCVTANHRDVSAVVLRVSDAGGEARNATTEWMVRDFGVRVTPIREIGSGGCVAWIFMSPHHRIPSLEGGSRTAHVRPHERRVRRK